MGDLPALRDLLDERINILDRLRQRNKQLKKKIDFARWKGKAAKVEDLRQEKTELSDAIAPLQDDIAALKKRIEQAERVAAVNDYFGDLSEYEILQDMIVNLLGQVPPESVTACRRLLRGVYVNIYDYVEGIYTILRGRRALLKRCYERGFFPVEEAKNMHLRSLLQRLFF